MFKISLSLIFVAVTLISARPARAQDQACADQPSSSAIANVTMTQVNCSSDYDCGYGNICDYGQCRPAQCFSSNQCFQWETCEQGRCQRDPYAYSCQKSSDCMATHYCYAGYCKHW